jgi:hypothetical protein
LPFLTDHIVLSINAPVSIRKRKSGMCTVQNRQQNNSYNLFVYYVLNIYFKPLSNFKEKYFHCSKPTRSCPVLVVFTVVRYVFILLYCIPSMLLFLADLYSKCFIADLNYSVIQEHDVFFFFYRDI